jgi:hypothetical protein
VPSDRGHRKKGTGHTRRIDPWPTPGIDPDVPHPTRSLNGQQESSPPFARYDPDRRTTGNMSGLGLVIHLPPRQFRRIVLDRLGLEEEVAFGVSEVEFSADENPVPGVVQEVEDLCFLFHDCFVLTRLLSP